MSATDFAAAQWTRAIGAGVDPHEYRRVTEGLASVADWGPSFLPDTATSGGRTTRDRFSRQVSTC